MTLRHVVIGAGMAGVLSAIKLHDAGEQVVVYEKASRIGGTWRENTYPGIACDVPSHLYSYSFAPNPEWSHTFAPGPEILAYLEAVAERSGILDMIRFDTEVVRLAWDDDRSQWDIDLSTGARDVADIVIAATGVLHHPRYPDIEGVSDFAGAVFHSARWDHSVPLEGARVGVIGTGSSAVQIVGALVDTVGSMTMFQRTPQWVLQVPNDPIADDIRTGYRADAGAMRALRDELAIGFETRFANAVVDADAPILAQIEELCRANLESHVLDADLRAKLTPDYRAACKRLVISPNFYESITRSNAHLVTDPIVRIEPKGVLTADGSLHELDVLVLATGFRVDQFLRPIDVVGRAGARLDDVWSARPSAYLSVSIPDFPNLFLLNGPNGPVGNFSLIDVAEIQFEYVMQLVARVRDGRCRAVSASRAAADRFERDRVEAAQRTVWVTGCRSWYLDDRGVPAAWPWTFTRFRELMAAPDLADYDLV
ncbi:MAG TPA: NAD(P)/FAD-dependent oxidoreductase [Acidimicrobiales bacterium]|jgi:cation diffusion facilitator CzcD-associated flavoprotein CzcO|nr:NAD(P)/FAD-dependent oxidoreductase [Acidimicrobiales bacterium]